MARVVKTKTMAEEAETTMAGEAKKMVEAGVDKIETEAQEAKMTASEAKPEREKVKSKPDHLK